MVRPDQFGLPKVHSKVCSRHFEGGAGPTETHPVPTIFNGSMPAKQRASAVWGEVRPTGGCTGPVPVPWGSQIGTENMDIDHDKENYNSVMFKDIVGEVELGGPSVPVRAGVSERMKLLQVTCVTPQPQGHDYVHTDVSPTTSTATQTLLTCETIKQLEDLAGIPPSKSSLDDFVSRTVLESDDRVNFDACIKPSSTLKDLQQVLVNKVVLPEQQEWNQSLDQKDSRPPNIKEEQEDLWGNQEGKQLHGPAEADITELPFTVVSVRSEDEEKPQSSELHQNQRDESAEVELLPSNSTEHRTLKVEAKDEDCGGSQPARDSGLQPDTDDMRQLLVSKEEVLPEQQEEKRNLDQKDSDPPDIKEEQEDFWESQEEKQLHGLEEADITELPFTVVSVKSEDGEKPQSSQLHQNQKDESAEVELLSSNLTEHRTLKVETKEEDCGGSQPVRDSGLQPDTDGKSLNFSPSFEGGKDGCEHRPLQKQPSKWDIWA
ncbi:uncharacterized protein LOC117509916 [Thalassophryne amazonica]|uniref:uncharacterized protein LOC117509916 n=1 Tax=Thalassophryne amazonica TaxID=390379 RepID=UPI00147097C9|nr:uncharacterized protein LOC117509916 [Thalassophryne amazonica]